LRIAAFFKVLLVPILAICCASLSGSAIAAQTARESKDFVTSVNVFIGTGQDGHTFPGATTPFGMVQLNPDTQIRHFKQSYKWAAGYRSLSTDAFCRGL
jgi:putative alpha-1,2-mannosidase